MSRVQKIVLALIAATWASSAWAYIDPGNGMLAVQALIAVVGAVVAFFRNPLDWLRRVTRRWRRKRDA